MSMAELQTAPLSRDQWLAARRSSVGASEASAIQNLSPFATPLHVYMDKIGEPIRRDAPAYAAWGLHFQPAIANVFAETSGLPLTVPPALTRHPKYPWMHASMDYLVDGEPLEIKRVSNYYAKDWGSDGSDEVPVYVAIQVQQQMACAGVKRGRVAAFIGWDDLRSFTIELNPRIIANLVEAERDFMDRVTRRDPPLPDFQHKSTLELLSLIEPEEGHTIALEESIMALADEYAELGDYSRDSQKKRDEAKARLIYAMGTAAIGVLPDGRRLRRKEVSRKAYTVQESSYIQLSILKAKGE